MISTEKQIPTKQHETFCFVGIVILFYSTVGCTAGAVAFSRKIRPNTNRTNGPAKNSCQHKAIGKLKTVVCSHILMICFPGCWNKTVAARLISGHIHATETAEMARIKWNGRSVFTSTMRNAAFFARFPTKKKSRIKAIGIIIGNSRNAARKTALLIPPVFRAML